MKKFKIAITIATMCLAIMVLCFGVYSATSVTYNIGGSISYQIDDVMVEVTTRLYKKSESLSQTDLRAKARDIENVSLDSIDTSIYGEHKEIDSFNTLTDLTKETYTKDGIEINYNNSITYFIVINVKSLTSDANYHIAITSVEQNVSKINSNFYKTNFQNEITKPITGENIGKNIVIAYSLNDPKTSIECGVTFKYNMEISKGDYKEKAGTLLSFEDNNLQTATELDFADGIYQVSQKQDGKETDPYYIGKNTAFAAIGMEFYAWAYNYKIVNISQEYNTLEINVVNNIQDQMALVISKFNCNDADKVLQWNEGSGPIVIDNYYNGLLDGEYVTSNKKVTIVDGENDIDFSKDLSIGVIYGYTTLSSLDVTLSFELTNAKYNEDKTLKFVKTNGGRELSVSAGKQDLSGDIVIPETFNFDGELLPITEIKSGNSTYFDGNGFSYCGNITDEDGNTVEESCTQFTISLPKTIKKIGKGAFESSNVTKVTFADGIKIDEIPDYSFHNCEKLEEIKIPQGVKKLGESAITTGGTKVKFEFPSSLVDISTTSRSIPSVSNSTADSNGFEFLSAYDDSNYKIWISTDSNSAVTSVTKDMLSGVRFILSDCISSKMTSLELPNTLLKIMKQSPYMGTGINISSLTIESGNDKYIVTSNCLIEKLTKTLVFGCKGSTIPTDGSVEVIGEASFRYSSIESVVIPSSVKRIEAYAFEQCKNLASVTFEGNSLTYIGYGVFQDTAIGDIEIKGTNFELGESMFTSCDSLTSVKLTGCRTIGLYAFQALSYLGSVTIDTSVKSIQAKAFYKLNGVVINYTGTVEQWKNILLADTWYKEDDVSSTITVKCTNGTLLYDATNDGVVQ